MHTVFPISNYTSYFLGLIKHRLFYIELHTVNSLLNTAKKFYILLSTVLSISNYSSQILYIIKLSRLYISLSNVFFASKFGWKTLYSASHRLYLFFHRLYPITQRLFYVIFHPVLSISNFWPSEVIYIFYILLSIVYIQLSLVSIFYFPPSFLYFVTCTLKNEETHAHVSFECDR